MRAAHQLAARSPLHTADEEVETPGGRALRAMAAHNERHEELVAALRALLKLGELERWITIRRALRLAGHRRARSHAITLALLDAFPDARLSRLPPYQRGPRIVTGVRLGVDLNALREALAAKWEARLAAEAMPSELALISEEYKLGPVEGGHGGRLHELVSRVHHRAEDASVYYGIAREYLHRGGWGHHPVGHKRIWALHCEGCTKDEIAEEVGLSPTSVQGILQLHRARCGITGK